jgi:hypothetical protein
MRKMALVLAVLGVLILAVVLVSWALFPAWRQTPGGFWFLLVAATMGVVTFVSGVLDVLRGLQELDLDRAWRRLVNTLCASSRIGQIPDDKGFEKQSVGDRYLAIQSKLEHHPLVVVWGPSGCGKSWEVARAARSRARSHKTYVLWLPLDKRDSLQSVLAPHDKLAGRLRVLGIPFGVSPSTSIVERGTHLLTILQENHLLVCFDNYHEVENPYHAEFEQLFSRMRTGLMGHPTRIVVINRDPIPELHSVKLDELSVAVNRDPIPELHSVKLDELSVADIALWIKRHADRARHNWVTDQSKVDELAAEWKTACEGNYFAMKFLAEQAFDRGDSYAELKEHAMKDAPGALRRAAWKALSSSEVSRIGWGAQVLQDILGYVDKNALLELVSPENRSYAKKAIDGLGTQGILEQVSTFILREEVRQSYSLEREEDRADLCRMAAYFEASNKYAQACELYLKGECFDQSVALLSEHSLELRRQGQAARMYELIDDVDADKLVDWLNTIRLWVVRADFLGWMGKLDDAEAVAECGLDLISSKCEEDRAKCRLEEIKLWIRRGIPPARRRQFEKAYDCFKRAEPLLLDYQKAINARRKPGEAERLAAVEQELILKNNLGLVYLNLALEQRAKVSDSVDAQENARKAKEAFVSGRKTARAQTHTNRKYRNYFSHLVAQFQLQSARYYDQWEGDPKRAIAVSEDALSALKRLGANAGAVDCATGIATWLAGTADFEKALRYAEESRQLAEKLEDWEGVAMAYATMSYDVYLAQAKQTEDLSEKDRLMAEARRAFFLSSETWREQGGKTESADLLHGWQAILTDLIDLQGERCDPEILQSLVSVKKSIRMLESAD